MMNLDIQRLSDENRHLIDGFSCVETDEMLSGLNAKERRRIRKHSQDMESFLRDEAYEDQEKGLSRTYLFVNDGKLVAHLALCNDAIRARGKESARKHYSLPYMSLRWSGITAVWFSSRWTAMNTGLDITKGSASSGIFTNRLF